jgi:predicted DNA-binding transcriptional regulator YafY
VRLDIPKELDEQLKLSVVIAGFLRAGRANVAEAMRAIAIGSHQITPCESDAAESRQWMLKCSQIIKIREPFKLVYQTPGLTVQTFEVRFAAIEYREKRYYLAAWVTETSDYAPSELAHNRYFRFDRILDITPAPGKWHSEGLDVIECVFRIYGKLAIAYERRANDKEITAIDGGIEVHREITEIFWFIRSVLVYGNECEVVAPLFLREEIRLKLVNALAKYE